MMNDKDLKEYNDNIDLLTKKQQELITDTKLNIKESRSYIALRDLFNVVDVEIKRFEQSPMLKVAMENAYKILHENNGKK